jgi:hypothetical protein
MRYALIFVLVAAFAGGCGDDDEAIPAAPDAAGGGSEPGADAGAAGDAASEPVDAGITCVDPAAAEPPEGPLATPAELDRSLCQPGALAGFKPEGLYYITEVQHSRWTRGPVRFSLSCEGGLAVKLSTIASAELVGYTVLTDDDLFFRNERAFGGGFSLLDAYTICGVAGDGVLIGTRRRCFVGDFGQQCNDAAIRVAEFGRIPGESDAAGLELVSEWRGGDDPWLASSFAANVRVVDGIAYIAHGRDGLYIVDVSDPTRPADLGHYPAESDNFNDVKIADGPDGRRYALMASSAFGVIVIDVSDPRDPQMTTVFTPSGDAGQGVHTLFVETVGGQTRAYLADGNGPVLAIYDITDPANPIRLGAYSSPNIAWGFHDLFVANGRIYGNATAGGMLVIDSLDDPANPTLVGQFKMTENSDFSHSNWVTHVGDRALSVHGEEGWGASIQIVDVDEGSATFMRQIGAFALRPEVSVHNIMAFGHLAFVAYYQDGVRILDLSDPTAPKEIAHFNTWDPATAPGAMFEGVAGIDVDLEAGLIYVSDTPRGLMILRMPGPPGAADAR